jgi:hypothetical protein
LAIDHTGTDKTPQAEYAKILQKRVSEEKSKTAEAKKRRASSLRK